MSEHDSRSVERDDFDRRARARYHEAAATLPPSLQGRLRAARREALQAGQTRHRTPRRWPVALPAALAMAAVLVLVVGVRGPQPQQAAPDPQTEVAATDTPDPHGEVADTAVPPAIEAMDVDPALAAASLADEMDADVLIYEHDPDFYLWLGGDDAPPAALEQRHDPT